MAAPRKSSHARTPKIDQSTVFKLTTSFLETGFGCSIQTPPTSLPMGSPKQCYVSGHADGWVALCLHLGKTSPRTQRKKLQEQARVGGWKKNLQRKHKHNGPRWLPLPQRLHHVHCVPKHHSGSTSSLLQLFLERHLSTSQTTAIMWHKRPQGQKKERRRT